MKKSIAMLFCVSLCLIMSACSSKQPSEQKTDRQTPFSMSEKTQVGTTAEKEVTIDITSEKEGAAFDADAEKPKTSSEPAELLPEQLKEEESMDQEQFYITVKSTTFTASFADNISVDAFRDLLGEGDLTINMSDYGGFEKVGSIGTSLPRKDTQISTTIGDVMLYQGSQIVIFYGTNSWSYSRLGKVEGATAEDLISAFGSGNTAITFSLKKPK